MKLLHVIAAILIAITSHSAQSLQYYPTYSYQSYKPGMLYVAGTAVCGASAIWSYKKVKNLEALSDSEKNKPEIKKSIAFWRQLRDISINLGKCAAVLAVRKLCRTYALNTQVQQVREQEEQVRREAEREAVERRAREEREAAERRAREEREAQARSERMRTAREQAERQQQQENERLANISPLFRAVASGSIDQVKATLDALPNDDACAKLLNTTDGNGRTAFSYAQQRRNLPIIRYALEQAARLANFECGICFERIDSPGQYAVGSPSFNCLHFFCSDCILRIRRGFTYETNYNLRFQHRVNGQQCQICPICRQP